MVPGDAQDQQPEQTPPVIDTPPVAAAVVTQGTVIATCSLQPNAHYGDTPLASIPAWSAITLLNDTQPDEYGRLWQRVSFDTTEGYIQLQNIRIG